MKFLKGFNESFEQEKNFTITDRFQNSKDITLSQSDIERSWDLSEEDFDGKLTLAEFLETCGAGESWESESKIITCQ